jgi:hypothetical protein
MPLYGEYTKMVKIFLYLREIELQELWIYGMIFGTH